MATYTRQDQIAVRDRYLSLIENDDRVASAAKAAKAVGCSETTAKKWLREEGVLRTRGEASRDVWRKKYDDKWERYALYLEMGYTIEEVADRFGVSTKTVHTAAKREGIDMDYSTRRHRRAWDPRTPTGQKRREKVRKMAEEIRRGKNKQDVAQKFGVSHKHMNVLLGSPLNPFNKISYSPNENYT